ncbi:MAG: hypothetical protein BAA01_10330 [Bacillus thermozeamaize]|uniref:Type I restriction modification DNA specificity domain-containing protein n=1 Tax=Bacillus thermozeamaize TaxID=230954 RepID=A0A1Y3PKN8_9BACI|nr:MAG: hypothetical protein BAA01_10330 [Bacillus thermozeamaize]
MGQSPASTSYNLTGDGIPFYQGNADFGEVYPNVRYFCNQPTKIAEKDDILISVRAPIGAVNIAIERCCIGRGLASLRAQKQKLDTKYLFYVLKRKNNELNLKGTGSTFKAINKQILGDLIIPLPPLEKQKQITKTLDTAADLLALQKQQLAELDNLIKSIFYNMFGNPIVRGNKWECRALGDIATVVSGSTPNTSVAEYWDGDLPWLTPAEISDDSFYVYKTKRYITHYAVQSTGIKPFPKHTVILSSRAPIGKVAIAGVEMYCNQGFKNIICGDLLNPIFLYCTLKFNTDYLNSLGRGATFKEITKTIVENIRISVPPLELQNQFANIVTKIEEQKAQVRKAIDETQTLFDSLMSQYFD